MKFTLAIVGAVAFFVAAGSYSPAAILEDEDEALFGESRDAESAMSLPGLAETNLLDHILTVATNQQQVAEKIVELRNAIAKSPDIPRLYRVLGDLYLKANRLDEAAEAYWRASRLDPQNVGNVHFLGFTLLALGDHENGIRIYRELYKIYPNSRKVLFNLASAYYSLEEYERASEFLGKYMKTLSKENSKADYNMGLLLLETGRAADALPWLERSSGLMPSNPFVSVALHRAATISGDTNKAESVVTSAESKYGKTPFQQIMQIKVIPAFIDR